MNQKFSLIQKIALSALLVSTCTMVDTAMGYVKCAEATQHKSTKGKVEGGASTQANKVDPDKILNSPLIRNSMFLNKYYVEKHTRNKIRAIKIGNSQEKLVDLRSGDGPRMQHISDIDVKFPKLENQLDYLVRETAFKKLNEMLQYLPDNIGIAYIAGYRSLAEQKQIVDIMMKKNIGLLKDKYLAYEKTTGDNVMRFIGSAGGAAGGFVEVNLFKIEKDGSKKLLDMGLLEAERSLRIRNVNDYSLIEISDIKGKSVLGPDYTHEQKLNIAMLFEAAVRSGFVVKEVAPWELMYGGDGWAFVKDQKSSIYGLCDPADAKLMNMTIDEYLATFQ